MKMVRANAVWLAVLLLMIVPMFADSKESGKPLLRHFVALKFKGDTSKEQVKEIEQAFQSLKSKIPQIVSLEWGPDISPEKLSKGFEDGFLVTFRTVKDRDAYLINPEHLKFKEKALPLVDDVFVMDFCDKH